MGENAKKLFEAVKDNKELQEKFKDIKGVDDIISVAKAAGYEITAEEIEAVAKAKKGELKDDELESVAGGYCVLSLTLVKVMGVCVG